jgi:hypothetical protein
MEIDCGCACRLGSCPTPCWIAWRKRMPAYSLEELRPIIRVDLGARNQGFFKTRERPSAPDRDLACRRSLDCRQVIPHRHTDRESVGLDLDVADVDSAIRLLDVVLVHHIPFEVYEFGTRHGIECRPEIVDRAYPADSTLTVTDS